LFDYKIYVALSHSDLLTGEHRKHKKRNRNIALHIPGTRHYIYTYMCIDISQIYIYFHSHPSEVDGIIEIGGNGGIGTQITPDTTGPDVRLTCFRAGPTRDR
jgi:hypothetical protein